MSRHKKLYIQTQNLVTVESVGPAQGTAFEEYAKGKNLFLTGAAGTGKTFILLHLALKEVLQKELIYRVAKFDEFVTPCTAGTYSYTIWEDGRVAPCEILSDTIGNLIGEDAEQTFQQMVESSKAKTLRKRIKDEKCKCTYECAMSTNTFFSWPMTKKMIKGVLTSKV